MANKLIALLSFAVLSYTLLIQKTHAQVAYQLIHKQTAQKIDFYEGQTISLKLQSDSFLKDHFIIALTDSTITLEDSSIVPLNRINQLTTLNNKYVLNQILFLFTGAIGAVTGYASLKINEPYNLAFIGLVLPLQYISYNSLNKLARHRAVVSYQMNEYTIVQINEDK